MATPTGTGFSLVPIGGIVVVVVLGSVGAGAGVGGAVVGAGAVVAGSGAEVGGLVAGGTVVAAGVVVGGTVATADVGGAASSSWPAHPATMSANAAMEMIRRIRSKCSGWCAPFGEYRESRRVRITISTNT
jgi:hypothetical protein